MKNKEKPKVRVPTAKNTVWFKDKSKYDRKVKHPLRKQWDFFNNCFDDIEIYRVLTFNQENNI